MLEEGIESRVRSRLCSLTTSLPAHEHAACAQGIAWPHMGALRCCVGPVPLGCVFEVHSSCPPWSNLVDLKGHSVHVHVRMSKWPTPSSLYRVRRVKSAWSQRHTSAADGQEFGCLFGIPIGGIPKIGWNWNVEERFTLSSVPET